MIKGLVNNHHLGKFHDSERIFSQDLKYFCEEKTTKCFIIEVFGIEEKITNHLGFSCKCFCFHMVLSN